MGQLEKHYLQRWVLKLGIWELVQKSPWKIVACRVGFGNPYPTVERLIAREDV